jgi:hypothetical protein
LTATTAFDVDRRRFQFFVLNLRVTAMATIEEAVESLRGNKESFRRTLEDKDELLARVCRYAEIEAERKGWQPWSVISRITGHGSGVSSAIYEVYREKPKSDAKDAS